MDGVFADRLVIFPTLSAKGISFSRQSSSIVFKEAEDRTKAFYINREAGFWPGLKSVGGDIQPQLVTVLTPATSAVS
jgi:UDP-N-acetylglucosamine enolpyruvyl transferase